MASSAYTRDVEGVPGFCLACGVDVVLTLRLGWYDPVPQAAVPAFCATCKAAGAGDALERTCKRILDTYGRRRA